LAAYKDAPVVLLDEFCPHDRLIHLIFTLGRVGQVQGAVAGDERQVVLRERRFQPSLRLPLGEDVAKRFEPVEAESSGVGDRLHHVIRPGDAGMAYFNIPFLLSQDRHCSGSRAKCSQLYQAAAVDRLF
jgi:hypothetical protein